MNIPLFCLTNGSKLSYILKSQEVLRIEHNVMGKWFDETRSTITLTEYNQIGLEVRLLYPFGSVDKLSKSEWKEYLDNRFAEKSRVIETAFHQFKNACYGSKTYSPNLDTNVKEV